MIDDKIEPEGVQEPGFFKAQEQKAQAEIRKFEQMSPEKMKKLNDTCKERMEKTIWKNK
jgi:hypothetical protein